MKTNPYQQFDKEDSLLFYSKEFIWNYKELVRMRKQEFYYYRYLVRKRLIRVLSGMNDELESMGLSMPPDSCLRTNYQARFRCENGRSLNESDSLQSIEKIVLEERNGYFEKHKNE